MSQPSSGRPPVVATVAETVADLERFLGDPLTSDGPFGYAAVVEHEERGELPPGAVAAVREWGFHAYMVPRELGGRLGSLEEVFAVTRSVARRNLTVAVMFGSALLGVNPVWLWGSEEQRRRVADGLLSGELACFAVSEPDHGSDLQANETTAVADGDELVLTGGKWPVGNATRGRFVTVYAQLPGRGQSLILVDKSQLAEGSWTNRPFVRTLGLRGHDLSGVDFHGARVPADAVLGRRGAGLVEVLKALQITRTAIGALSLGTMDAALRIGLRHAQDRVLYGAPIRELPVIRELLTGAHLDLLIAECTALPAARALSVAPSRMSLWSSVVKYLVPVLGEEVVLDMGRVLGARGYLAEGVASGVFQKLQRDHAIASIFEGTTHVNLHAIASQLPKVAAVADRSGPGGAEILAALFDRSRDAPEWHPDGNRLQLTNATEDEITRGWGDAVAELARLTGSDTGIPDPGRPADAEELAATVAAFGARRTAFYHRIATSPPDPASTGAQRDAAEHCVHHAAACCVLSWLHNRGGQDRPADLGWLILTLQRLLGRLEPGTELSPARLPRFEEVMTAGLDAPGYFGLASFLPADTAPIAPPSRAGV
ncbi:acyl-CoA dehydrogenase family protein [Streptacidiphilus sp. N1-3]|uniref:Acyl-CoA dehydrogenase family protein n=1 Tax=Streptacidiphilus alkalitolerans TaxID=3342712 RepID=A0ABV6WZP8_9ACTN